MSATISAEDAADLRGLERAAQLERDILAGKKQLKREKIVVLQQHTLHTKAS